LVETTKLCSEFVEFFKDLFLQICSTIITQEISNKFTAIKYLDIRNHENNITNINHLSNLEELKTTNLYSEKTTLIRTSTLSSIKILHIFISSKYKK